MISKINVYLLQVITVKATCDVIRKNSILQLISAYNLGLLYQKWIAFSAVSFSNRNDLTGEVFHCSIMWQSSKSVCLLRKQ